MFARLLHIKKNFWLQLINIFKIYLFAFIYLFICMIFAGDYVMVEQIKEGMKVKGEICNILRKQQIEYIQQQGLW